MVINNQLLYCIVTVPLQNVLVVTPMNLTVEIGSTAVFNCSNSGLLENEFFWIRNSSDPTNSPNLDLISKYNVCMYVCIIIYM